MPEALDACVDDILGRLAAAQTPVLMVGVEVRRYKLEDQVAALADRLGLPVVSGFMGRGLLAGAPVTPVGTYLGVAGDPAITDLVENSDALFLLGEIICDTNFAVSHRRIDMRRTVQALNGRVTLGFHSYADIPLAALVARMLERAAPLAMRKHAARPPTPPATPGKLVSLAPSDISRAVNELFAIHGPMPVASDMGDCMFAAFDISPTQQLAPGYYATMGYGVPAGLGIQAATGQRPLVLVGDGAFQMTGWELGNCRRYGWDPIVLVFNNASWGMLHAFQPDSRFNSLDHWDFASMASGMGGEGARVDTYAQLQAALANAYQRRGRFQLLDITIPQGTMSETLSRYVAGMRRSSARTA